MKTDNRKMEHYRQRGREVLVDFDGTLCEFEYPELGPPREGAQDFIGWLITRGLRPVVWSSRISLDNGSVDEVALQRRAIVEWLIEHNFPPLTVDDGRSGKRLALAYVDDRGVAADSHISWFSVKARITMIQEREDKRWEEYDNE